MDRKKIAMWMYSNGGGDIIQNKLIDKLKERYIDVLSDINLREAIAKNGHIIHNGIPVTTVDNP